MALLGVYTTSANLTVVGYICRALPIQELSVEAMGNWPAASWAVAATSPRTAPTLRHSIGSLIGLGTRRPLARRLPCGLCVHVGWGWGAGG